MIPSPCYILDEKAFRKNLSLLRTIKESAEVEIILAFKAFAMWSVFPIVREYITHSTASSLAEAQLAYEEMGSRAHTYAPAYSPTEFEQIASYSSHVTFNSLTQFDLLCDTALSKNVSCGLRINPQYSEVGTSLYNPCSVGSRLGATADKIGKRLPKGIEGLHFHTLCESNSFDLEKTLHIVEQKFGHLFSQIKWINMGGGHLITHADYDTQHLVQLLQRFKYRHPHLQVILEPGSAFAWQTGELASTVLDIVENDGIQTAMLDVSFSCHMPDCLEMPYKPTIREALSTVNKDKPTYRMGGNSCLSGDFYGDWSFDTPLHIGSRITFEDMIHYTMVKTTMFNGVSHPSIGIRDTNGEFRLIKSFGYKDYRDRLS